MGNKKEELPVCVRCRKTGEEKDRYCTACGAPLINRCSDDSGLVSKGCGFINQPHAAFCAKCGEETVFKKAGLVAPFIPKIHPIMIK